MRPTLKHIRQSMIAAAVLGLSACASTLSSSVEQARSADLHHFSTYAWVGDDFAHGNTRAPNVVNPLNKQRIRDAIEAELADKGYRQTTHDKADFVIAGTIGANERIRVNQSATGGGFGRFGGFRGGYYGSRFGGGFNQISTVRSYQEGVLVLDVFDTRSREAVWHGAATKRLSKKFTPPELIDEAVMTLLEDFPSPGTTGRAHLQDSSNNKREQHMQDTMS